MVKKCVCQLPLVVQERRPTSSQVMADLVYRARRRIQFPETLIDGLLALAADNLDRVHQTSKRRRE